MARRTTAVVPRFEPMSRLKGFTVEKGTPDVRGWEAADQEGRTIGKITDLLVDTDRMVASHLIVDLDLRALELNGDPRVLVPMANAHRDGDRRRLIVSGLTRSRVAALFAARAAHDMDFWESWWRDDSTHPVEDPLVRSHDDVTRRHAPDDGDHRSVVAPAPLGPRGAPERERWSDDPSVAREREVVHEPGAGNYPVDERGR
jgi:hypothetical protein